jgi:hypothetical protein
VTKRGRVIARRLCTEAVASIIKRHGQIARTRSLPLFGSFSACWLCEQRRKRGMPTWRIKAQTGHPSDTILALYIREAEAVGLMPKPDHPASGG